MAIEMKSKVHGRIAKPVSEVFEAVVDPETLSKFFTTGPEPRDGWSRVRQ